MTVPKPVMMAIMFAVLSFVKPSAIVPTDWHFPSWIATGGSSAFKEPGLKVLVKYEQEELSKLPPSQLVVLNSTAIRGYLKGKSADFRCLDQHAEMKNDKPAWQEAMKWPTASLPWVFIGDGKKGNGLAGEPLPATEADTLTLLKKYGGE